MAGAKRVSSKNFFLYAMVGLILARLVFSWTKASGPKQKSEQYAEPVKSLYGVYSIGAVRLWRDYEENEVAADTLHLFGGNTIFPTMATLNKADIPAAAQLKKGDQVVVRCIGAGREMPMPQLERCLML
jgi:hypothetical protein